MHYLFSLLLFLYTVVLQSPLETGHRIGEGIHPAIGTDPTGGVHVVFGRGKSILYTTSTDGIVFSNPLLIDSLPGLHLGASRGPQIAATAKSVVITAIDKAGNVWAYALDRSTGRWQKHIAVTDVPDVAKEGFVAMAAGSDNSYNAVWLDLRGNQHNKLVGAHSTDGGKTWSKNQIIYQSPDGTICECCQPSMVSQGRTVAIMFRNFLSGSRDMYVLKSADGGQTFGKVEKMGEGTWKLNACPMDGGGLSIATNGVISTVWRRADKLFTVRPGQAETELGTGKNAKIVTTDKGDYIAFQRDGQVWTTRPEQPQPVAIGEGGYPKLSVLPGNRVLCLWEQTGTVPGRLYSVRTTTINYMKNVINALIFFGVSHVALAQHQHHEGMAKPGTKPAVAKPVAKQSVTKKSAVVTKKKTDHSMSGTSMPGMNMSDTTKPMDHSMHGMNHDMDGSMGGMTMTNDGMTMDTSMGMTHSLSRNLSMNRNGSGTSWHPDNTPMYAYMRHPATPGGWSYMLHYAVYLRYTSQNANNANGRGQASQFGAPNWVMGMAQRKVGQRGLFQVRAMLSLDPLTVGNGGYPLLFQTGETYKGRPLIDRQHPHDLVSELSVSYAHAFSKDIDLYGYVGYPGEPAMGPPAFMHRISAFNDPNAPLSHHWQDATHILFGVSTVGVRYKWIKLEGSAFTGREPDENRYNFDKPRFDSYSYRISVNPSPSLALQFSQGFLNHPEEAHPEENVVRTTASVLHSKGLGREGRYVTSAFVWGMNAHDGVNESAYLAESSLQFNRLAFYGRYENVGKSAEELGLYQPTLSTEAGRIEQDRIFIVNNLTLGMNYRLAQHRNTDLVLGAQLTGAAIGRTLQTFYGKTPISGQVYLRLSPSLMTMSSMKKMGGHKGHTMN